MGVSLEIIQYSINFNGSILLLFFDIEGGNKTKIDVLQPCLCRSIIIKRFIPKNVLANKNRMKKKKEKNQ